MTVLSLVTIALTGAAGAWARELHVADVLSLRAGMTEQEAASKLGQPDHKTETRWTYESPGKAILELNWSSSRLESAEERFRPSLANPEALIPKDARLNELELRQSPSDTQKPALFGEARTGRIWELSPTGRLVAIRVGHVWKESAPSHSLGELLRSLRRPRVAKSKRSGR
jgi:hypothetical protein